MSSYLAEAGLSECASAGDACNFGFGLFFLKLGIGLLLVLLWFGLAAYVSEAAGPPLNAQRTAISILAVWLLPIIGSAFFFWYREDAREENWTPPIGVDPRK
ncbi:hypothetical protein QM797_17250 [Rhodococcus sp. IEGM 1381]|uniref:hypothetical protein n=1 Tax=Rhodococcus sp. IEGM 1381 TaxID=3047085 RepID=UPI0024B7E876|nr:hypothetical protein [Rhodococcus sp. IEGM 1381]MDI9896474.1 hypothetical protein [Rhodococcus sp. IEGM 1381]